MQPRKKLKPQKLTINEKSAGKKEKRQKLVFSDEQFLLPKQEQELLLQYKEIKVWGTQIRHWRMAKKQMEKERQ